MGQLNEANLDNKLIKKTVKKTVRQNYRVIFKNKTCNNYTSTGNKKRSKQ